VLRNAEIKSLIKEKNKFQGVVSQFELLYKSLPGDMIDATDFWSGDTSNGNGDGQIASSDEAFRAIDQLALADLIDGAYSGSGGSGVVLPGRTSEGSVYPLAVDGVGIYIRCCGNDGDSTLTFNNTINLFTLDLLNSGKKAGLVSPIEAYNIDLKYDDGIPDAGFVGAIGNWGGSAYTKTNCYSSSGSSSTYDKTGNYKDNAVSCQLLFAYDWD
jgi:hypothetical protein